MNDVSIYELFVGDDLFGDRISDINAAFFIGPSVIIEEDVLSLVVSLIDQEEFSDFTMLIIFIPVFVVFLDSHR